MKKPIPFGKYLLLERINVGGMAEVFLAKSFGVEGFERILAVKKILPTMVEDEEFITMFIDEARIAVQLNHANIVQIYELGKHDENYFIAMEYVSGQDLRTTLDRFKQQGEVMPIPMAVYIAQKMAEGLDYAHRKKDARGNELHIVHRDVSPQNVLISYEGEVKIIDFGIAKAANRAQKTQAGILKGKFGYMSPEQVRGLPIDRRSDIFAVGVCLYEMLTGEKLFVGESDFSTLEKVRNAEVVPPRKVNADIPEALEAVVLKALARDVEDRYQHASELQEDLMRFLLTDGTIYGAKHLGDFMHQTYAEELAAENQRMERYAHIEAPPELISGVTQSAAGVHPPPSPRFEEPPPSLLAPDDGATVLVDASEVFEQGTSAPGSPASAEAAPEEADRTVLAESPLAEEAPPELARAAAAGGAAAVGTAGAAELGSMGDLAEDTDATVGARPPPLNSAPLGDPLADVHQDAVGRLAAEVPSHPGLPPPDAEGALLDQATRLTTLDEVQGRPPPKPPTVSDRPVTPPVLPAGPPPGYVSPARSRRVSGAARSVPVGGILDPRRLNLLIAAIGGPLIVLSAVAAYLLTRGSAPGAIIVYTKPDTGIRILVDGQVVGNASPEVAKNLEAGDHVVTLEHPALGRVEKVVTVEEGKNSEVHLELEPLPGGAPPPGAPTAGTLGQGAPGRPDSAGSGSAGSASPSAGPTGATGERAAAAGTPPQAAPTGRTGEAVAEEKGAATNEAAAAGPAADAAGTPGKKVLGVARIESEPPGAKVFLGETYKGVTPLTVKGLNIDEAHTFTLEKEGYLDTEVEVAFDSGTRRKVRAKLERIRDPHVRTFLRKTQQLKKTVDRVVQRKVGKAGRRSGQKHVAARPKGKGTLVTSSHPVAQVYVDGKDTGRWTPIPPSKPLELPAGRHVIEYRAADGRRLKKQVTIRPGEMAKLTGIRF